MNVSIVILAAGASSRMGTPKQLLPIEGKSLIKRITDMAMDTPCYPIVVVLGANRTLIRKELERMPITIIDNPQWEQGMSSSIKMGLVGAYMTLKEIEAAIFTTVDMPYVSVELINKLIDKASESADSEQDAPQIVACKYNGQVGVPVLFKRTMFNNLLELKGEQGAKKIVLDNKTKTALIDFPEGKFDLDTIEDYTKFVSNLNQN